MDFDSPTSSKHRFRSSACFSCCFGSGGGADEDERPASLFRSSTVWLRSKAQELPEIGGRYRNMVARIGKHGHRRRQSGGDFGYDPLSYALNFDEGDDDVEVNGDVDRFRYRDFSSRLPPSPPAVQIAG